MRPNEEEGYNKIAEERFDKTRGNYLSINLPIIDEVQSKAKKPRRKVVFKGIINIAEGYMLFC